VIRGEAGRSAIEDGLVCRALVALTQRACNWLARAGSRRLEAEAQDAPEEAIRFMNDLSGGGSRTREAARLLHR